MKKYNDHVQRVGVGDFGDIFQGVKNEEAIQFLLNQRSGEVVSAIIRDGFGTIDIVYGKDGYDGYGLAHIEEQRPGFSKYIPEIVMHGIQFEQSKDRVLFIHNLPDKKRIAVVRLDWNGKDKHWVVTGFGDL